MAKQKATTKRGQISEAQSRIMLVVSVATLITVFCLMSAKALWNQASYQKRLINAKHVAVKQLADNKKASQTLVDQYNNVFQSTSNATNIIGGKNDKSASAVPPDGDNARIVLDALPTTYDYAGLLSSVAKILSQNGIKNQTISGKDESATADSSPKPNPTHSEILVTIGGESNYDGIKKVVNDLERSIRPFNVTKIDLTGSNTNMTFTMNLTTYYQVAKTLDTSSKGVN